ncbi:hypothetical protein H7X87_00990 [Acetobacteraceae bacterium]|nr:hypothetical protein [Candidatus Parcubacteria bacterium]
MKFSWFLKRLVTAVVLSGIAMFLWLYPATFLAMIFATDAGTYGAQAKLFLLISKIIVIFVVSLRVFFATDQHPEMWQTANVPRWVLSMAGIFLTIVIVIYIGMRLGV